MYFCATGSSRPLEPEGGTGLGQADQVLHVLVLLPFPLLFGRQAAAAALLRQVVDACLQARGGRRARTSSGVGSDANVSRTSARTEKPAPRRAVHSRTPSSRMVGNSFSTGCKRVA